MADPSPIALAVIQRRGKYLFARRPESARLGGLWEFPGGKIEPGESASEAAARECREELGCDVIPGDVLATIDHDYGGFAVRLTAIACELPQGADPRPLGADELAWLTLAEVRRRPIPEANHRLLDAIERRIASR